MKAAPILTAASLAFQCFAAMPLKSAKSFMYQIDKLEAKCAVDTLARSDYDMVIVEPMASMQSNEDFDMKGVVKRLHDGKSERVVLAQVSIGEAEKYLAC